MTNLQITEHRCDLVCEYARDQNVYITIRSFNENWVFHKFHYACEKCVYDGEAQYVGELMTVYDVVINYCPYCGRLLNQNSTATCNVDEKKENISEHKCDEIKKYNQKFPHIGSSFDTDAVLKICYEDGLWFLERHSIASERMVEAGEASKGELIFWSGTTIKFCPFCGDRL